MYVCIYIERERALYIYIYRVIYIYSVTYTESFIYIYIYYYAYIYIYIIVKECDRCYISIIATSRKAEISLGKTSGYPLLKFCIKSLGCRILSQK